MTLEQFFAEVKSQKTPKLSDVVYKYLKDEILELRLTPGQKVNIASISSILNTSRTPIRTAFDELIAEGLVEENNDYGMRIKPIMLKDYLSLCQMRTIIEGEATYIATIEATDEDFGKLKSNLQQADIARKMKKYDDFAEIDQIFHATIIESTKNPYIISAYKSFEPDVKRYRRACAVYRPEQRDIDTKRALQAHESIYKAMQSRFADVARNAMRYHIDHITQTVLNLSWDFNIKKNGV